MAHYGSSLEFSLDEVTELVARHGFEVLHASARNLQHFARRYRWVQWIRPDVWNEHLVVVARRNEPRDTEGDDR
ncbi:MAG: hypothetical protein AB7O67_21720 [Vicinamibacterales bacterium]